MTKWSKNDPKWPRVGLEKMFKNSGKYRLRDCTWKLAQPWPRKWSENGKQFTRNKRLFRDAQETIQRLFLAEPPPAALAITIGFYHYCQ